MPGGGCNCCFQVGALEAICERYSKKLVYIQAVSGGALNAAKLVEGNCRPKLLKKIWLDIEKNGKGSLFPSMGLLKNFLIADTPNKKVCELVSSLDCQKIIDSAIRLEIVTRNSHLNKPCIFSNHDIRMKGNPSFFKRPLLASTSIPGFMPPVIIDGQSYSDGFILLPEVAARMECDMYFVIISDHHHDPSDQMPWFFPESAQKMVSLFNYVEQHGEQSAIRSLQLMVGEEKLQVIRPSITIPSLGVMSFKEGDISAMIEHGKQEAENILYSL